ncbi:MAG: transcriptional regulator, TetR family [Conexibacter sp.]|jgi:AcrR family transcriptional regulator|nr:transcriptional regulator, TetR family [Conexibacter sp.]
MPHALASAPDARDRLVAAMTDAVGSSGYGATTIAEVVRRARVSKRTFYEHFDDKEACFLAAYDAASAQILRIVADAAAVPAPWDARLERAVGAYLEAMAARPELDRAFLVEILGAGPRALARRREHIGRFAEQLAALSRELGEEDPALRPLSPPIATAIVAGINELVLLAVEQGRVRQLPELRGAASELIRSAIAPPREPRRREPDDQNHAAPDPSHPPEEQA